MANFRRFRPDDLNKQAKCNLDPLTETYELSFYMQYYAKWPSLFQVAEDQDGNIIGYSRAEHPVTTSRIELVGRTNLALQLWGNSNHRQTSISSPSTTCPGMPISPPSPWHPRPAGWASGSCSRSSSRRPLLPATRGLSISSFAR